MFNHQRKIESTNELEENGVANTQIGEDANAGPQPETSRMSRLEQKYRQEQPPEIEIISQNEILDDLLVKLCNRVKLPFDSNVLQYFKNNKEDRIITDLAQITLGIPATQVSVERAFSALALLLTPHRTRLTKDHLNNMLLIKLNKCIAEKCAINFDNLN